MNSVLSGMHNRTFSDYLTAINRIPPFSHVKQHVGPAGRPVLTRGARDCDVAMYPSCAAPVTAASRVQKEPEEHQRAGFDAARFAWLAHAAPPTRQSAANMGPNSLFQIKKESQVPIVCARYLYSHSFQ
jgi:hypothetical protein